MKIIRGLWRRTPLARHGCALTIGNFDGVHRGHQAMLTLLQSEARHRGVPTCAMTFEPHPRDFFAALHRKPELARRALPPCATSSKNCNAVAWTGVWCCPSTSG